MPTEHETMQFGDIQLHLYKRPNSANWQCGFHHKGVYNRTSTKCAELPTAKAFAQKWFYAAQGEIERGGGRVQHHKTFGAVAIKALDDLQRRFEREEISPSYYKTMGRKIRLQLIPTRLGKMDIAKIDQPTWVGFRNELLAERPNKKRLHPGSIHLFKVGIRIVLNYALNQRMITSIPTLRDGYNKRIPTLRTYFTHEEYDRLIAGCKALVEEKKGTRTVYDAMELYDFVEFMAQTGLRIGEAMNIKFKDVELVDATYDEFAVKEDREDQMMYPIIRNIKGKRSIEGICKGNYAAEEPFLRIVERRIGLETWANHERLEEKLFVNYHQRMFYKLLHDTGLYIAPGNAGLKRDLMSLRSTYICHRLIDGRSPWDIAANCRTSVQMIQNNYAIHFQNLRSNVNSTRR